MLQSKLGNEEPQHLLYERWMLQPLMLPVWPLQLPVNEEGTCQSISSILINARTIYTLCSDFTASFNIYSNANIKYTLQTI